ncbi:hypothetical protein AB0I49_16255 [Streptomyces sp. NPDC050617]|uniref:DUF6255 family natural product biosynthesis protein n=1 Tax=Streptomyces sp. NPDC050617 TaxID=3154628 RepID=UPI0034131DA3
MKPTRRTVTAIGWFPPSCDHARQWRVEGGGIRRCQTCGTERTESYESLRLPLPALTAGGGGPGEPHPPGGGGASAAGRPRSRCQFGVARTVAGRRSGRQADRRGATGRWRG